MRCKIDDFKETCRAGVICFVRTTLILLVLGIILSSIWDRLLNQAKVIIIAIDIVGDEGVDEF